MSIFIWQKIGKEEMPEFQSNWIRVNTGYPGASAEDVELFVTKPIEDELKGVAGIEEIRTTSAVGSSSVRITIDDNYPDLDEVTNEIKDAVLRVNYPSEVRDLPRIRQFKSASKAIMDLGVYLKDTEFLDQKSRALLQSYVLSFESQIMAMPEISSIERRYYLKPEVQIMTFPDKMNQLEISLSMIKDQIQSNHVRSPIGSMRDKGESKVTAMNELETVESLDKLVLQGNYQGMSTELGKLAYVRDGYEESNSIFKINGHEAVFLNVQKNISTDILTAQKAVVKFLDSFRVNNKDAPIEIVMMDDESYDVSNRLNIVSTNGAVGFVLILLVLLIFLDLKSGFWVAMGIPFCAAFTLIIAHLCGYTINNMTLAGIIIVLGIVVDDAIIIAENITRKKEQGIPLIEAAVTGTTEVFVPIVGSIATTCVAFIPLIFFEGFFGKLVSYIPLIVILMLVASLVESLLFLPGHMVSKTYIIDRFSKETNQENWFYKIERKYKNLLLKFFHYRAFIILGAICFLILSGYLYSKKMSFVMFPREESSEIFIRVTAQDNLSRLETAKAIAPIENVFKSEKNNVVALRSRIGVSRRGGEVRENEASILVELYPADERTESLNKLLARWEEKTKDIPNIKEVKFVRGRWGHDSGNSVELQIQENDDVKRKNIVQQLEKLMKDNKDIVDVEVEKPILKDEYVFHLRQDLLIKYNIAPSSLTTALRSFVEGSILYSINKGEEEVDVRLTVPEEFKSNIDQLLALNIENKSGNLIPIRKMVRVEKIKKPVNIQRTDYKRTTMIYANANPETKKTPLEIAEYLEQNVFPELTKDSPTTVLSFKGEIEDTRESQGEFGTSVIMVVILIYFILVLIFNSLFKPFLVLAIVPFGVSGIIYVLLIHGMSVYGFFAAVGALGMIGVVVNDAIVMIDKIDKESDRTWDSIAAVAATRLRPIVVTTLTTVAGILPTAYGLAGYDSMLAEMMLTMGWGLFIGTIMTLILLPIFYSFLSQERKSFTRGS